MVQNDVGLGLIPDVEFTTKFDLALASSIVGARGSERRLMRFLRVGKWVPAHRVSAMSCFWRLVKLGFRRAGTLSFRSPVCGAMSCQSPVCGVLFGALIALENSSRSNWRFI